MKIRRQIILILFTVISINLLGQSECGNIDESALRAYDDSVRPINIELYRFSNTINSKHDTLSLSTIHEIINDSGKSLTDDERQELDYKLFSGSVVGDTTFNNVCYEPDYILKIIYKDGYLGFVGVDSKCKSLKNYKTRYRDLEFSGMLYLYFIELIKKYGLE